MKHKKLFRINPKKWLLAAFIVGVGILALHLQNPFFTGRAGFWSVGYSHFADIPDNFKVNPAQIYGPGKLSAQIPDTEFLADPFFLFDKGKYYLFFEHKKFYDPHASIGVLISDDGRTYKYGGDVLSENFHLSYPQVFRHKGSFFMLPEAQGSGHVILYESKRFPFDWKPLDTLIHNVKLKDPSIYLSDSLNIIVAADPNLKMMVYTSDSLRGKWRPHQKHIALSGSESRPAGRFFVDSGKLMLPVQNHSNGYGSGVSLYEFRFSGDDYTVERSKKMYLKGQSHIPQFTFGMHHLDIQKTDAGYYTVYDGIPAKEGRNLSYVGSLKMTYNDFLNLFR